MKLSHIDYASLSLSPLNVRKHGADNVDDLVRSIRAFGLLQPLLVREAMDGYEIVAGQRRYKALGVLMQEGAIEPVPCAVMESGDDAKAIEASLAENLDRLPMDALDQYAAFAKLVELGQGIEDIAAHYGVSEQFVRQRLAIANLDKRILVLFRREDIKGDTLRILTMATVKQQKAWLKRFRDPEDFAPQGRALRQWLLGGQQIATSAALFDLADYKGAVVSDLFGEEAYFADPDEFWTLQKQAVAEREQRYRGNGWSDVVVLEDTAHFPTWDYAKITKRNGGKVYVTLAPSGEATFHEGYLSMKEIRAEEAKAKSNAKGTMEGQTKTRPELTKAAQNYVDLHRHAAVQASLLSHPDLALRAMAAHIIAGSALWSVKADKRRAENKEIAASVESSAGYQAMVAERKAVLDLLGVGDNDGDALAGRHFSEKPDLATVFAKLATLTMEDVRRVLTYVMAETLSSTSPITDALGTGMEVALTESWQADAAFLDAVVNKETLKAMAADIGGGATADAHKDSTSRTIRSVILQFVTGEGRAKVDGWVPPHMLFPQGAYGTNAA